MRYEIYDGLQRYTMFHNPHYNRLWQNISFMYTCFNNPHNQMPQNKYCNH